ncbi:hypothetical protein VPAL9027_00533 [Vibrio palustris]|uniref:Uncharacterized protein n=1 Tax=Vibrio palustris TaxID=1918946 RepID=A0A1R4B122_9VIBR|nr:hypothetical protein VPAL9027_00533 [Vibrio palustris]
MLTDKEKHLNKLTIIKTNTLETFKYIVNNSLINNKNIKINEITNTVFH